MLKTEEPKSRLTFMARITNLGSKFKLFFIVQIGTILHVTKDDTYAKEFV
jgi:hypothetical protein